MLLIATEAKGQSEDAMHMRVIELARCDSVSVQHPCDKGFFSLSRAWVESEYGRFWYCHVAPNI